MKRLCLSLAAMLGALTLTASAHALSCMQTDIERELTKAIESDEVYHVFVGYFTAPEKPKNQLQAPPPNGSLIFSPSEHSETVNGSFFGFSLAKYHRDDVSLENVTVQIKTSCTAHWCGQVPKRDQKMIAFVQAQDGAPPLLTLGACPYMSHPYDKDKVSLLRRGL